VVLLETWNARLHHNQFRIRMHLLIHASGPKSAPSCPRVGFSNNRSNCTKPGVDVIPLEATPTTVSRVSKFVNLDVRDTEIPWPPSVIPTSFFDLS
jgi:hypothetical protein